MKNCLHKFKFTEQISNYQGLKIKKFFKEAKAEMVIGVAN